jgi:DNA-directed RNA polymerase subunit N (RpoN/RPB10)
MGTILESLGLTSYTCATLFFALKSKVKKLLSFDIVIFHTFAP